MQFLCKSLWIEASAKLLNVNVVCCSLFRTTDSVPLGEPLMDTVVEVRDDKGQLVTEGEGQVFIGKNSLRSVGTDDICAGV